MTVALGHPLSPSPALPRFLQRDVRGRHSDRPRATLRRATTLPLPVIIATVLLPFAAGYYLSYVFRTINAVIASNLAAEFKLGPAELGFMTSVYFLAFVAVQLPAGVALDRYGPRRVQSALLLVAAVGLVAVRHGRQRGGPDARPRAHRLRTPSRRRLPERVCHQPGAAGQRTELVPVTASSIQSTRIPRAHHSSSARAADLLHCRWCKLRTCDRCVDGTHRSCSAPGRRLANGGNRVCRFDVGALCFIRPGCRNSANCQHPCRSAAPRGFRSKAWLCRIGRHHLRKLAQRLGGPSKCSAGGKRWRVMLSVGLKSPRNNRMQKDEREGLRKNVATENNFQLYKCYSEKDAAKRIGWDYSTVETQASKWPGSIRGPRWWLGRVHGLSHCRHHPFRCEVHPMMNLKLTSDRRNSIMARYTQRAVQFGEWFLYQRDAKPRLLPRSVQPRHRQARAL